LLDLCERRARAKRLIVAGLTRRIKGGSYFFADHNYPIAIALRPLID
jgi:hypothetical protein